MLMLDKDIVLKGINTIVSYGKTFEISIQKGKTTTAGIFKDPEVAVRELEQQDLTNCKVSITINDVNDDCYNRQHKDKFTKASVVKESDIDGYNWIFIKCIPKRPDNSSTTTEEYKSSSDIARRIFSNIQNAGFTKPIIVETGNEWGLLVNIGLSNTENAKELVKDFLQTLNNIYRTENVRIDTDIFKPNITIELPGILTQVGPNTSERPHRMANLPWIPPRIEATPSGVIKNYVSLSQERGIEPEEYNAFAPNTFNVGEWLNKHKIEYTTTESENSIKYTLRVCPWDKNDISGSTIIIQSDRGIYLKCLNDVFNRKTWDDLRRLIEPTSQEKRESIEKEKLYHSYARDNKYIETDGNPIIESPLQILDRDRPELSFIKTGISEIDRTVMGLIRGGISLWTGLRGGGKSSVLSQIAISAINDGNNTFIYSGELRDDRTLATAIRQTVGKPFCNPTDSDYYYTVDKSVQRKVAEWMDGKLWIYNNDYPSNAKKLLATIEGFMENHKLDLLILDNLMTLDIIDISDESWHEKQQNRAETELMKVLKRTAEKHQCHIALVAHPRKLNFRGLIRLSDVAGTSNLGNLVDAAFMVHRINTDFRNGAVETFGIKEDDEIFEASNCIEISKDRLNGVVDHLVPLYYEIETKRYKNYDSEYIIYPWNTQNYQPKEETLKYHEEKAQEEEIKRIEREIEEEERRKAAALKKKSNLRKKEKEQEPKIHFDTEVSPENRRLSDALKKFRDKYKDRDYDEVTNTWRAATEGKWASTMTEEDWNIIENLEMK